MKFLKEERLCSKTLIEMLFDNGSSFLLFPYRISYFFYTQPNHTSQIAANQLPKKTVCPVQILISVSKKKFKHATDRNRLKRQTREAYRLNKKTFYEAILPKLQDQNQALLFAVQYIHNTHHDYALLDSKMQLILKKMTTLQNK